MTNNEGLTHMVVFTKSQDLERKIDTAITKSDDESADLVTYLQNKLQFLADKYQLERIDNHLELQGENYTLITIDSLSSMDIMKLRFAAELQGIIIDFEKTIDAIVAFVDEMLEDGTTGVHTFELNDILWKAVNRQKQ